MLYKKIFFLFVENVLEYKNLNTYILLCSVLSV